jgi:CBS domain-containing protein
MRPITAADLMNPKVLAVRDDMTLRELAAFLIHNQITGAPVEDGSGRLVGVVSMVDIAESMVAARGALAGEADDPAGAGAGAGAGADSEVDADPEADEDELEGLRLAKDDLLVRDIMTPTVFSVSEDATVSEVASRMLDSHVHRLLVTREGKPVGIVSTSDLLGLLVDE